ncbi:LysR family transcriptional regulator [Streptomyces coelicoflavus]|uniref:LysR family transcriptional regulator n=1 Tax=Streptomyces coelicoflavus TaxID=285562 RepID=UPI0036952F7F
MDLENVRTFLSVVETGRFQGAAVKLSITQQAVSKRIAAIENDLGARLFHRDSRGVELTAAGRSFLPSAQNLVLTLERAKSSVTRNGRPLRIDVCTLQGPGSSLVRGFRRIHSHVDVDVVVLKDSEAAVSALVSGDIDASLRPFFTEGDEFPADLARLRIVDEELQLLTGLRHEMAKRESVTPSDLSAHRILVPAAAPLLERSKYFEELCAKFNMDIQFVDERFGPDELLDEIIDSPSLATLAGSRSEFARSEEVRDHGFRRVPIINPTPLYPHSLLWSRGCARPALDLFISCVAPDTAGSPAERITWTPSWSA